MDRLRIGTVAGDRGVRNFHPSVPLNLDAYRWGFPLFSTRRDLTGRAEV